MRLGVVEVAFKVKGLGFGQASDLHDCSLYLLVLSWHVDSSGPCPYNKPKLEGYKVPNSRTAYEEPVGLVRDLQNCLGQIVCPLASLSSL